MKNIKFLKEPGYTYDLFFLFVLYFNKQVWLPRIINQNKTEEDTEYFNRVLEDYLPISDELLLFFYWNEGNRIFMTERYLEPYVKDFIPGKYNLSVVLAALSDYEQVVDNVIRFYFRDIAEEELPEYRNSLPAINRLIKESKYKSEVKSALYAFFIEPVPVIQKLIYELMAKEILLAQQYQKGYDKILETQAAFDCDKFAEDLLKMKSQTMDMNCFDNVYISFCLHCKNTVFWKYYDQDILFTLGIDYVDAMEFIIGHSEFPDLDVFGNAVSEKNRVEILNLMLEKEEVTIKDIEQELGFTGTNAYYHLMLMIKAGMLKTRNQGRTVLYRIDKNYFVGLVNVIKKYIK